MLDLVTEPWKPAECEAVFHTRRHSADLLNAVVKEDCCDEWPNFLVHDDHLAAAMLALELADRYPRNALSVLGLYEPSQIVLSETSQK